MNFYISYFAQFRNMTPKQICFSTAIWDPKWFHDFKNQSHKFIKDKKVYGLRATCFNPQDTSCRGMPCQHAPSSCAFLKNYDDQLSRLDFKMTIDALSEVANIIATELSINEPDVVLLVHETPDKACSERHSIIKWFKMNGVEIKEWKKPS